MPLKMNKVCEKPNSEFRLINEHCSQYFGGHTQSYSASVGSCYCGKRDTDQTNAKYAEYLGNLTVRVITCSLYVTAI